MSITKMLGVLDFKAFVPSEDFAVRLKAADSLNLLAFGQNRPKANPGGKRCFTSGTQPVCFDITRNPFLTSIQKNCL